MTEALRCSECAAPITQNQARCDYCGFWLKQDPNSEFTDDSDEYVDFNQKYGQLTMAGLGLIFVALFSLVIMAILGQFATVQSIWPNAKAQAVASQTATSFLDILLGLVGIGTILTGIGYVWHTRTSNPCLS